MLTLPTNHWSIGQKIAFRFFFLYFAIFIVFNPNIDLPIVTSILEAIGNLMQRFIPWFAQRIFGLKEKITVFTNGSGDTTYNYFLWLFGFLLALIGTAICSGLDRKRNHYSTLWYWISVAIRYYLICNMITYGLVKVIKLQFPFPSLHKLMQPAGNMSPMGLAWSYIGYSKTYNTFIGIAEILGGLLLVFRRTTVIGALVTISVMLNVFMMNMSYDIPVKILSFNTVLMCLFLLWNNFKQLFKLFFQHKTIQFSAQEFPHTKKWQRVSALSLKWLFVGFVIISNLFDSIEGQKIRGTKAPKPPLWGIFNVQRFVKNNDTLPPLQTDTTYWKSLIIDRSGTAVVRFMNDSAKRYAFEVDTIVKRIVVYNQGDTTKKYSLAYLLNNKDELTLTGRLWGDSVDLQLKKYDINNFRLVNRGFHWINELPFNR